MTEGRLALVVATDRYDDNTLRGLAAPAADAEALANALGDPELGDFEVSVLSNATSWEIAEQVDGLLGDRRPSDLVLLHFSCHGLKDDSGELYLASTNTRPDRLTTTAVDAALINRLMRRSRAQRIVLLLDCCYGGAFERGVVARAGDDVHVGEQFAPTSLAGGRGRVVITASSAMEYAFEGTELTVGGKPAPSLFTSALVQGICTGAADRDHDGTVSLDELYDHVYEAVQARTPNQTPGRWEFGVQGELMIARNPRQVIAAPPPADVLERARSGAVEDRLGAVEELSRLARGTDLGVAAGAAGALAPLVSDGSRWVSQAAQAALDALRPRPEKSRVDLGQIRRGQPVRVQLNLEGSPLALASTVHTSGPEVTAQVEAGRLSVRIVATHPGPVDTSVTLTGAAGDVRVDIAAEAVTTQRDPAGPGMSVVVPLVLLGAAAVAGAWLLKSGTRGTELGNAAALLALPAAASLLAVGGLRRPTLLPAAVGTLAGAAAWAVLTWAKNTVGLAADPATEVFADSDSAHWLRLAGGVLLGAAVTLVAKAAPELRERVTWQRGGRFAVAGLVVLAGALVPVAALPFQSAGEPPVVVTEWALVLAACLPVALCRFGTAQRRAALTGAFALCLFTVVRAGWVVVTDLPEMHAHLNVMVAAGVLVLGGCLLGQLGAQAMPHGRASYPPGIATSG